jgi:hypothetical protein
MRGKGEDGVGGLLDSNRRREKISEDARRWEASNHIVIATQICEALWSEACNGFEDLRG